MTSDEHGQDVQQRFTTLWPRVESARWSLGPLLKLTRDLLEMDLALLTEVTGGREEVRRAHGEWPEIPAADLIGRSLPMRDTFCQRLLEGTLPPFVSDVREDPASAQLDFARTFGVGAWIGACLDTHGARMFILCCLAREARPGLGERDVYVLSTLATSLASQLDLSLRGP